MVASFFTSTAVIFGPLIAFLSSDIWMRNKQAQTVVFTESDTLIGLYCSSAAGVTDNAALPAAIRGYVSAVVEDEWPRMAVQDRSPRTDAALNALLREVAKPANAIVHCTPGSGELHSFLERSVSAVILQLMRELRYRVRQEHIFPCRSSAVFECHPMSESETARVL